MSGEFILPLVSDLQRHGAFSGCGWRRRPADMEGICEYIEQEVADSPQVVVLKLGGWEGG
jgi:hypothetical protein